MTRSRSATHTLFNPYGHVWMLSTARGQFIRAITADGVAAAATLAGPLDDDINHHWLRRGPGRYSRTTIPSTDLTGP
jgi:tellurite resistance protein